MDRQKITGGSASSRAADLGQGTARVNRWPKWLQGGPGMLAYALFALLLSPGLVWAAPYNYPPLNLPTRAEYTTWLQQCTNAKPDFKPGDVLTQKDIGRIRCFIPPGYLQMLNFPGFRMEIGKTEDHTPRKDFVACTEQHLNQPRLAADGSLENYVCGQPFPNSSFKIGDPTSGIKAAWNFEYRWQDYGLYVYTLPWMLVRFVPGHHSLSIERPPTSWRLPPFDGKIPSSEQLAKDFQGGGVWQRVLQSSYQRLYYSHLAMLPNHTLDLPNASKIEFKEFTGFFDPFDIRGTAFITIRYTDPHKADDSWAYLPTLRRVRRISAQVKSDSLLGTDHTLADFYGFSGRILSWKWKFLGWKKILAVFSSKYDYAHYFGPYGTIPNDRWTLRRYAVIERTPKLARNPYATAIDFWDSQNYDCSYLIAFDRSDKLWKIFQFTKVWSEDFKEPALQKINKGVYTTDFQTVAVTDLQNRRATLNPLYGLGWLNVDAQQAESLYDISKLEVIHR